MFNRLRVRLREGFQLLNGVVLVIGHGVTRNRLIAARWFGAIQLFLEETDPLLRSCAPHC